MRKGECYYCDFISRSGDGRMFHDGSNFIIAANPFTGTPQLIMRRHRTPKSRSEINDVFDAIRGVCRRVMGDGYYLKIIDDGGHLAVLAGEVVMSEEEVGYNYSYENQGD